jgi:hypothetical protein
MQRTWPYLRHDQVYPVFIYRTMYRRGLLGGGSLSFAP